MKKILLLTVLGASMVACTSKEISADRDVASVDPARKYFIIQNLATERTRIYEKCQEDPTTKACVNGTKNRLVFETEMVVGGDEKRSDVGVQNIERWTKFYEDAEGHYPSWYNPDYPATPEGGYQKWFKSKHMPTANGKMRGAFGWYTALMSPSDTGQWMHGTIGHGDDGDHFIRVAHGHGISGFIGKTFSDMRSHGCTRHENRAIAYIQSIVPDGTALIKIYAKEGLADASLSRYESQKSPVRWDWMLTKEDVYTKNREVRPKTSSADAVKARLDAGKIGMADVIEQGTYEANQYPNVVEIRTGKGAESGKSGDAYKIFSADGGPRGLFLVDEGVVTSDYRHPSGIKVDGISSFQSGKLVPNYAYKQ